MKDRKGNSSEKRKIKVWVLKALGKDNSLSDNFIMMIELNIWLIEFYLKR